jgi:hypothetical protein
MRVTKYLLVLTLLFISLTAFAQEPPTEEPLAINYFGELGWIVKYGLGDSRELSRRGYANQLLFEQYVALTLDAGVEVTWPLSGTLRVSAQLDNRKGGHLQSFAFGFKNESLETSFKDFSMAQGSSEFVVADRLLKGLIVTWQISESIGLTGKLARVEGIAESRVFRGNTARETARFTLNDPERPWAEAIYLRNLRGLEFFSLQNYVPGFTVAALHFQLGTELKTLLDDYGLSYLYEMVEREAQPEIEEDLYTVLTENGKTSLLLKRATLELLRDQLRAYIDEYNDEHELFGDEAKEYPMAEDTDYERAFFNRLIKLVQFSAGAERYPLGNVQRGRFFSLGREKVKEDTLKLEIKRQESFVTLPDPGFLEFTFTLFAEPGLLALDFPEEFFRDPRSEVRVTFDYAVSGGLYILGLAVLQNSERVYLNNKLLKRDVDYQIDYETGALLLLPPHEALTEQDELKIEYELMRGGLGGFAEHQRTFVGISLDWSPWPFLKLTLDALRAADGAPAPEGKERLRTMPNAHTVFGVRADLDLGDLKSLFKLGYANNIFPSGKNQRRNQVNQINVIASLTQERRRIALFGHQNGLLVSDGTRWQDFTTAHGLSGRGVRGIAATRNTLLIAADSGLSLVRLEPGRPVLDSLAKPVNWKRFYRLDGLPHNTVNDVLLDNNGVLWVATHEGLARVLLAQIEEKNAWKSYKRANTPGLVSERFLKLAHDGTKLYVGTDKGLLIYDPATERFESVPELQGEYINDLVAAGATVYAATKRGVYRLFVGQGLDWVVDDLPVRSLSVWQDELWYGTEIGLFRITSDTPILQEYAITALEKSTPATSSLWAGPKARETYQMPLWQIDPNGAATEYSQAQTRLNGRDEFRFADIPADKNTDRGWFAQFSTEYKWGALDLQVSLESAVPEFTAIGREERQDAHRLKLSASLPVLSNLTLSGEHTMGFSERFRTFSMSDALRAQWQPWEAGPKLSGTLALELLEQNRFDRTSGFDTNKFAYGLKAEQKLNIAHLLPLAQDLAVSATYDGAITGGALARALFDSKFSLTTTLSLTPSLRVKGTLGFSERVSPGFRGGPARRDGDLSWSLGGDWQYDLGFSKLNTSYARATRQRFPGGRGSLDENASVDLRFSDFAIATAKLTPTLTLSARRTLPLGAQEKSGSLSLSAEGRAIVVWQPFSGSVVLKQSFSTDLRSARDLLRQDLNANIDWALSPELKPRADFGLSLDTLVHPTLGRKQTLRERARLSLSWDPPGPWRTGGDLFWQMTISERERTQTYELGGQTSLSLWEKLALSLEARAALHTGLRDQKPVQTADWELVLKGDYDLGVACAPGLVESTCNLSAVLGYSGRFEPEARAPWSHSLFAQAQLGINF